jgi:hypothetical protein
MTRKQDLKQSLFESLVAPLAADGFTLKAATSTFRRKRNGVTDLFQIVCPDGKSGWRIHPNVGVRIDRVEDIFHQTSGFEPEFQKDTPTIGNDVGHLTGGGYRGCEFWLEDSSAVSSVASDIVGVFEKFALPYFEKFGSVSAIDQELNSAPTERTANRGLPWLRCATGVIVAKLSGRRDYDELVEIYTDKMRSVSKGFYLERFEALLRSLESVQPEGE